MRDDDKPDIQTRARLRNLLKRVKRLRITKRPEWLRRAQERTGLIAVPPILFLVLLGTWAVVALTLFVGFYAVLWQTMFQDPPEGREAVWNWRFSIAQLVAVTTVAGAVIALPLTLNRLVLTRRQTNTIEQGHITDRINTAVEGLGAEKTVKLSGEEEKTVPNLEVRIGAIYALERIAQDSPRDHVQIMEILCAYIRQNAPAPVEDDWPELEMKDSEDDGPLEPDWEDRLRAFRQAQDKAKAKLKLREDIQVALTVIGRRSAKQRWLEAGRGKEAPFPFDTPCPEHDGPEDDHDPAALEAYREKLDAWRDTLEAYDGYRLDLRNADLRGVDLAGAELNGARLDGTYLQGADLTEAQLQGADLKAARLHGSTMANAQLQAADFSHVKSQGANLKSARLQAATLSDAQLHGASFERVQGQVALFYNARLQGANLTRAGFQGTVFYSTRLQGVDFSMTSTTFSPRNSTLFHINDFKGPSFQGAEFSDVKLLAIGWGLMFDDDAAEFETNFRGSALRKTYLPLAPRITRHLASVFGDASVILSAGPRPGHDDWPSHWPTFELGRVFNEEWRKWQADPDNYTPPDPPDQDQTA